MEKLIIRDSKGRELILDKSHPYLLSSVEGIGVNSNISTISGDFDGVNVTGINLKEKILSIRGAIVSDNKGEMQRDRARFISFLNPNKGVFEFIYRIDGHIKKIRGNIQRIDLKESVSRLQKFQIQILAPFPYWEEFEDKMREIALWSKDAFFPLVSMVEKPVIFGHRVSNLICEIYNNGDVKIGMKIELKALATVVNPSVLNVYTKEFIKIMQILEKDDVLEITTFTNNKRILIRKADGSTKNVFNWMTLDSEFLQLDIGKNTFRYDAESGIDNIEMRIFYNIATVGV